MKHSNSPTLPAKTGRLALGALALLATLATPASAQTTEDLKLLASDGADYDGFGSSVAITEDGDTALVSAVGDDDNGILAGAAYMHSAGGVGGEP